ncbi:MAG: GreA/GreB family elongation factor [Candidatus Komeilibacteria bacterium]|nr:GreA/GreB family elongation factor [Candidatus Komeilibacteria bacterium]
MQIPYRKPGEFTNMTPDPHLTQAKFDELTQKLKKLKAVLPGAISELQRLAEMGDFSENAAYQMAKGRVRSLNDKIFGIEEHLKQAIIIAPGKNSDTVQLGSTVTVMVDDKEKVYQLLGSSEVNLAKGIISNHSPVGESLMGKKVGDVFKINLAKGEVDAEIIGIK